MYEEAFCVVFIIGLGLFCLTVILVRLWAMRRKNYWKKHQMPHIESKLLLGNFASTFILKKCITDAFSNICKENEDHVVGVNIFHKPALIVRNHDLIKRILLEDKSFFVGGDGHSSVKVENSINYKYIAEKQEMDEFLSKLESVLSCVTQTNKSLLNEIFDLEIAKVGQDLCNFCKETSSTDLSDLVAHYTIDVIFKLIYNIDTNCLVDEKSPYRKHKRDVFKYSKVSNWVWRKWKSKKHNFVLRQKLMDVLKSDEKSNLSILMRALLEPPCEESDQIVVDIKSLEKIVYILVDKLRLMSSTLIFCIYELAKNPETQEKLRTELKENFEKTLDYKYVNETKNYLHNVIQETLRLHPSPSILKRDCDFPDDEEGGYSLAPFYEYKVPRKMPFLIPVHAILRDEKNFTNPDVFNPDRHDKIHEILPLFINHHLEGSNTTKLVVSVLKAFLINICLNFKITLSDNQSDCLNYNPTSVLLLPNDPISIEFEQM